MMKGSMIFAPAFRKSATARSNRLRTCGSEASRSGRLTKHTDPPAHGAPPFQERRISRRDLAARLGGRWIRRVDTGDNVKQSHKVGDGAGHRTCSVTLVVKPNHAGPGNQRPTR